MSTPLDHEGLGQIPGALNEEYLIGGATPGQDPVLIDGTGELAHTLVAGSTAANTSRAMMAPLFAEVEPPSARAPEFGSATFSPSNIERAWQLALSDEDFIGPAEAADRTKEVYSLSRDPETYYEVNVESSVTLEQYWSVTPEHLQKRAMHEATTMLEQALARGQRDVVIVEINSTWEGGGVAMQVPPFTHFTQLLLRKVINEDSRFEGMTAEVHWLVGHPDETAFNATKWMHNARQDVLGPDAQLTPEIIAEHQRYGRENILGVQDFQEGMPEHLRYGMQALDVFQRATHFIIDDPQLSAGLADIRRLKPDAQIDTRNHIMTDRDKIAIEGSLQEQVETYLNEVCGFNQQHAYMAHPVEQFVPYGTENVAFVPPISDPFEDLNKPETEAERQEYREWINRQLVRQNKVRQRFWTELYNMTYGEGNWPEEFAHVDDQAPIPWNDPELFVLTEFSRFDRAKAKWVSLYLNKYVNEELTEMGTPEALRAKEHLLSIIVGNGATDDPDRNAVLHEILGRRSEEFDRHMDSTRVFALAHNYGAVNALERDSKFIVITSTEEGFEHRPTEGVIKENDEDAEEYGNVPAIISDAGGLPLQVREGISGHVIRHIKEAKVGYIPEGSELETELRRVARHIAEYIVDRNKYRALKESTHEEAQRYHKVELGVAANTWRVLRTLNGTGDRRWLVNQLEAEEPLAA